MSRKPNKSHLSTHKEAIELAADIPKTCGGGIYLIYVPGYGGSLNASEDGKQKFWHFAFNNGMKDVNVGLIRESKKKYPATWVDMLAIKVNAYKPPTT